MSREYRKAMGKFATGVTVITTNDDNGAHGMTANAFMSVSLDPKLVTISIGNQANMLSKIRASGQYAISFLSDQQQDISMHFAGQKRKKNGIDFGYIQGVPVIKEALANVVCDVYREVVVGDHTLFIGRVIDYVVTDGEPLTFYIGKYGAIKENEY